MPFVADAVRHSQLIHPAGVVYGPNQISEETGISGAPKECRDASEVLLPESGVIVAQGAVGILTSIRVYAVQMGVGLMLSVADVSDTSKSVRDLLKRWIGRKPTPAAGVVALGKGSAVGGFVMTLAFPAKLSSRSGTRETRRGFDVRCLSIHTVY